MEKLTGNETVPKARENAMRPVGAWAAQAVLVALAAYVVSSARGLGIWLPQGPGPGFFPLVLAVALIVLSLAWLVQTRRATGGDAAWDATGDVGGDATGDIGGDAARDVGGDAARDVGGDAARDVGGDAARDATGDGDAYPWKRPAAVLASLVVLASVLDLLGFQLAMLLFLLFQLRVMGRCRWLVSAGIAVAGSVGGFHLFNDFLLVPLPYAGVPPLTWLGV